MKTPFKYSSFYEIPSSMESVDIVAHIMSESWGSFKLTNSTFNKAP